MPGERANLAERLPAITHGNAALRSSDIEWEPQRRCRFFEEFLPDTGATLPAPWGTQDTSAAGAPTLDYQESPCGIYKLGLAADVEAEALTLYFADHLVFSVTDRLVMTFGLTITGVLSADDRIVAGLATARNATLNSVADHVWFRMEGANNNILIESDDGTTDTDDKDTGFDWTTAVKAHYRIDATTPSDVKFYKYNTTTLVWDLLNNGNTMSIAASVAKFQPFFELQKDAGAEVHDIQIDYVEVLYDR